MDSRIIFQNGIVFKTLKSLLVQPPSSKGVKKNQSITVKVGAV